MSIKYPSTPYLPWSPSIGRDNAVHPSPERFLGVPVVVTEKLDGGNTLLHRGNVYARSVEHVTCPVCVYARPAADLDTAGTSL